MNSFESLLRQLANLHGVNISYFDMEGKLVNASSEALLAILDALGQPVSSEKDLLSAIRAKVLERWKRPVEPVLVFWDNEQPEFEVRVLTSPESLMLHGWIEFENGDCREFRWFVQEQKTIELVNIEGQNYLRVRVSLPEKFPYGYHFLYLEVAHQLYKTLIISSPIMAYQPDCEEKIWGVFLPLYALRLDANWGSGTYADLNTLYQWISSLGGRIIGTLPLLPLFLDKDFGPSPYMPASRLFWNEIYTDIINLPEMQICPQIQSVINSGTIQAEIKKLGNSTDVDYIGLMNLKRNIFVQLLDCLKFSNHPRYLEFRDAVNDNTNLNQYACFRAVGERRGICWDDWDNKLKAGIIKTDDYDDNVREYYLYSQWVCQQQIEHLSSKMRKERAYLYLDLPVGVHPYSYDIWRYPEIFVRGVSGGAPPDPVFTSGQNWGFPPLHPENIRNTHYEYFIKSIRHQLSCANMLRIDHIMNFHRFFWIPHGMENRKGVYVRYNPEEFYAILTLESWKNRAIIIGEDLGMVPPEVRPEMEKHGIFRMFVGQYQLISENQLGIIPVKSIASLNTHDMFPFASFWQEEDIIHRQKIKLIDSERAEKELDQRKRIKKVISEILLGDKNSDIDYIYQSVLSFLGRSPAYGVIVNLEDLWLETRPQNIPGTQNQGNWTRKARYSFEEFSIDPTVLGTLKMLNQERSRNLPAKENMEIM